MSQASAPITPYQRELHDTCARLKAAGWNAATPAQIAEQMQRTVTPSLRRRLKQLAADGLVHEYRYYTERGGLATAYWFADQLPLSPAPAFPF